MEKKRERGRVSNNRPLLSENSCSREENVSVEKISIVFLEGEHLWTGVHLFSCSCYIIHYTHVEFLLIGISGRSERPRTHSHTDTETDTHTQGHTPKQRVNHTHWVSQRETDRQREKLIQSVRHILTQKQEQKRGDQNNMSLFQRQHSIKKRDDVINNDE